MFLHFCLYMEIGESRFLCAVYFYQTMIYVCVMTRLCEQCQKPLQGRRDKKFCDDYCRSAYNQQHMEAQQRMIRKVNQVLNRNRSILRLLCPETQALVHKQFLTQQGFNEKYFTSILELNTGVTYRFCYEYGYAFEGEEHAKIIKLPLKMAKKSDPK